LLASFPLPSYPNIHVTTGITSLPGSDQPPNGNSTDILAHFASPNDNNATVWISFDALK